ncbi:EF hand protein (macronuclear) [Tetrahymena thermophila SB210]|uniref:EF hand protein n=1 Tax=Tetrahymena thermophila (strain SB210) TaxID=312017 RepID=I7MEI5_TETTS|nr:EF hand protein [Tetrahymena thermophila SB210]EAR96420.2 EF hand protein [Tetrahymena thermophila SB210]|eukprot:XP_001016665.2 EF hand protein [Tetrahymena thermophila SB210]
MKNNILEFQEDIANIIKGIAFYDIIIENEKIKIAENPNFDPYAAWSQIDLKQQGYVDAQYLNKYLSVNRIAASVKECQYILNLCTTNKNQMTQNEFINFILPKTNTQLKKLCLQRREMQLQSRHAHFLSDSVILRNSEYLASEIFLLEIKGFREIEDLRKNFKSKNQYNIQQIFQVVDNDGRGVIDYEVLHKFMKKNGVQFNEDEFKAFISRTTEDGDSKLDYEELIVSLMPIDPYIYPHYREQFNPTENNQYVIRKAQEFKTDALNPPVYFEVTKKTQNKINKSNSQANIKYYSYNYPIRKVYNPYENGRPTYNCDEGYMGQLKSYRDAYYNPSRENTIQYTNRFQEGIRYHDQHFEKFYKFIHDRDQSEQLFNKFGKRYAYDENMNLIREQMLGLAEQQVKPKKQTDQTSANRSVADTLRFATIGSKTNDSQYKSNDNVRTIQNNKSNVEAKSKQQQVDDIEEFDEY